MNKHLKEFLHRGLMFGGFGPIVVGIVLAILGACMDNFSLGGSEVLIAIISTYVIAFVQAGASVFNQIEHWPIAKSLLCHFSAIYLVYVVAYLINSWIPFDPMVIVIFSAIFIAAYLIIWTTVFLCVRATRKKLNSKIK